jgi:hypothetical protein
MSLRHELERRRLEVCVEPYFPGGPDAHVYVPETCRKKAVARGVGARRGPRPQPQNAHAPAPQSQASRASNRAAVRAEVQLLHEWLQTHRDDRRPGPAQQFPSLEVAHRSVALLKRKMKKLVETLPTVFMAMIDRQNVTRFANVHDRFAHVTTQVEGASIMQKTVYELMLAHWQA